MDFFYNESHWDVRNSSQKHLRTFGLESSFCANTPLYQTVQCWLYPLRSIGINTYKAKSLSWNGAPVETVASRMGETQSGQEKPQAEFVPFDSPQERPCFNSVTVSTQGLCLVPVNNGASNNELVPPTCQKARRCLLFLEKNFFKENEDNVNL